MASILLSAAGTAMGGGPLGGFFASALGRIVGGVIDNALFGGEGAHREGPRLADLAVQTSTYGKMINFIYGTMRVGGNIIWSRPIHETGTTSSSSSGGGKGGGGKASGTSTTYTYSASLAIGICEGPIDDVLRVWADARQLDLSQGTYRIYKGDESQLADPFIESFEGVGTTPAYRGLAYVVIEDFPLADYGNRIPNFTFEVKRAFPFADYNGQTTEEMITGVTLIPSSGEFVYDTQIDYKLAGEQVGSQWVQQGNQVATNAFTPYGKADVLVSLDQLEATLPNVEWISVTVAWFGDNLDAGTCVLKPGVEYASGGMTTPQAWAVSSFTRSTARAITVVDGSPQYGGTPDDSSIVRLLTELRARGYKIMFYPLIFMDTTGKPWRGNITGSAANVGTFFTKTNGYNAFVTHYANLTAGLVDAFAIGSELVGLTSIASGTGVYPAVTQLVSLASSVKTILGSGVKVTYAADWSEYHHTAGGWYNLDPLWASSSIDVIGIDAYFPLTDAPQTDYNLQTLIDGWTSGEGYDWYYSDVGRTTKVMLTAANAWKNISWWWNHTHVNPNSVATAWVPGSKKIWFTEYGFPSVDGAANQPNVFYDPASVSGSLPHFSKGRMDARAQRLGITATEAYWQGSTMVEQKFLWTWDARPYPYWPDLNGIWKDGSLWRYGHWVQGKLGLSSVAGVVKDLCRRAGFDPSDIDASQLNYPVEGFVIPNQQPVRNAIEQLQAAFFFDTVESDHILKFIPRGGQSVATIDESYLLPVTDKEGHRETLTLARKQELELPQCVNVLYVDRVSNYQQNAQTSQRMTSRSQNVLTVSLPISLADQAAKSIADVTLFNLWIQRLKYHFDLPIQYAALEPTDIIHVSKGAETHTIRITSVHIGNPGMMRVEGIAEDISTYDFYTAAGSGGARTSQNILLPATALNILDIPALPSDPLDKSLLRYAGAGVAEGWTGAVVYRSDDGGTQYHPLLGITSPATMGITSTTLASGSAVMFDNLSSVSVTLIGEGTLASSSMLGVLNGANTAMIGSEMVQFTTATLTSPGKYTLSGFLRGRLGTEWAIGSHIAGENFVLLDNGVVKDTLQATLINQPRIYKGVTVNDALQTTASQTFTARGVGLKPYSPVRLTGIRDGSGNLTINWIRRSRLGGAWLDYADVPLNEDSEVYEVDILNGVTVVRTIKNLNSPTASYSAAQQVTDFGSAQSSISIRVYQLSAIIGRGYAGVNQL